MRYLLVPRPARPALVTVLLTAMAACSDSGGTGTNLQDLLLDFCSGSDTPVFVAVQNEGQNWARVTPDNNGTIAFRSSDKVGLAFVYQTGPSAYFTDILYTTRDELQPLANDACPEQFGTKVLNGSVSSVSGAATADVTMGGDYTQVTPPPSTFTLSNLISGPLDLVASRSDFVNNIYSPNRVIVRRGVNLTNNATIPALDFGASEALAPTATTGTISGLSGSDNTSLFVDFSTATTPYHPLFALSGVTSSTATIYGIPSTLTQAGDFHILSVRAESGTGNSYRVSEQYYRDPADKVIALGAALNAPTVSPISTGSALRLSASLPAQADYPSFASAVHTQGSRVVSVTGTASYFGGTPTTWVLDMPDLSTVGGYSTAFGLTSALNTQSYVEAYSGTIASFFGDFVEGGTLKFAGRLSGAPLAQLSIKTARSAARSRPAPGRAKIGR